MKNGVYEKEFYTIDKILSFLSYLRSDIKIDPSKNVQQMIMEGLFYDLNEEQEEPQPRLYENEKEEQNQSSQQIINHEQNREVLHEVKKFNDHICDKIKVKKVSQDTSKPVKQEENFNKTANKFYKLQDDNPKKDSPSPLVIKIKKNNEAFRIPEVNKKTTNGKRGKTVEEIPSRHNFTSTTKQPVIYNFNKLDFNNTKNVINNIEREFKELNVINADEVITGTESSEDFGDDYNAKLKYIVNGSQKNMKRLKQKQKNQFNENLNQIKKKNKLLDYIIVIYILNL